MLKSITLFLFTFICCMSYSQDNILYYDQSFWGSKFIQNEKELDDFELKTLLYDNPESYQMYKKGVSQNNISIGLTTTGTILVLSSLFTDNLGTKLTLLGGGLAVDLIALIPAFGAQKKFKETTYVFNRKNKSIGFKFGLTPNGIGLQYTIN